MKRLAIVVLAASIPAAANAQATPYKLIISWFQADLTVIDYQSKARCESAAKAVNEEVARRTAAEDAMAPGSSRIGISPNGAFCIPS